MWQVSFTSDQKGLNSQGRKQVSGEGRSWWFLRDRTISSFRKYFW